MEDSSSQSKKRKPPPRRNMEARREQNRIASRNYREKRKQKLALLNQLLEPDISGSCSSATSSAHRETSSSSIETDAIIQDGGLISEQMTTSQVQSSTLNMQPSEVDMNIPMNLNIGTSQVPSSNTDNLIGLSIPTTSYPSTHLPDTPFNTMFAPLGTDQLITNHENQWKAVVPSMATEASLGLQLDDSFSLPKKGEELLHVVRGLDRLSLNQKQALLLLLQHQIQYATSSSPSPSSSEQNSPDYIQIPALTPRTRMQLEAIEFSISLGKTAAAGPSRAPNDYVMNSGLFSALFANCYALGMTDLGSLLTDDGWSIFGLGPEIAYHPTQLSVVRAKFRNITPALRPCDKQLTFPHHPYIDIFPFKTFRERILEALDHDPPLIDEDILCQDLLTGLTCWGSQQNTLGMEATVPWDARSWEPRIWFLQKYRNLVGGWDDEMWKGARWWHSMRGERIHSTPTTP
ncbi:hypothetical protein BGZ63DRAFT_420456 [Mariannaea sp. PMI_226]|nr:hypothetical protein BGZ63DRAFT_420456 [Mariannaea sp. PMI_226]